MKTAVLTYADARDVVDAYKKLDALRRKYDSIKRWSEQHAFSAEMALYGTSVAVPAGVAVPVAMSVLAEQVALIEAELRAAGYDPNEGLFGTSDPFPAPLISSRGIGAPEVVAVAGMALGSNSGFAAGERCYGKATAAVQACSNAKEMAP